jgi:hypothetical protein
MSAPISAANLATLELLADTPAELERFLRVFSLGYGQCELDALYATLTELKQAA